MPVTQPKLLVPLDGSELAERALAEALVLGRALQAEVTLLQVLPAVDEVVRNGAGVIGIDEQWELVKERALMYLNRVRNRPDWQTIATRAVVETGDPARTILDYCEQQKIDRIVMSTHGRTGMSRWVFDSVAEKVVRAADRTVVLIRAGPGLAAAAFF
jgi:nucleotide-binding universal stress UspA family protein